MRIDDRIYGPVEVDEPVLLAVMETAPVRRLRGVLQHGITGLLGITNPLDRYEHSVGVMLLVRRLGAPVEEQIAALLHDVSHTAFSHVIDYLFQGEDGQSYHEAVKADYIARTELPDVLARHGYDWRAVLDDDAYPLLEQPLPALCADRIDYFLRDSVDLGLSTIAQAREVVAHLVVHEGRIMLDDPDVARWMADTYMAADHASWSDLREVGLYELAARAIGRALASGDLSTDNLWGEDRAIWAVLRASTDPQVRALVAQITTETRFAWDDAAPDFRIYTRVRSIDPDVVTDGAARPLSALDPAFAARLEAYMRRKAGKWPIRVIPAGDGTGEA